MDRETLVRIWTEAWNEGIWFASWRSAVDGLSARQAAWKPDPSRHSIWQIVTHIMFWQEYTLRLAAGDRPAQEEVDRRNFEEPADVSERAWGETRARFAESHQKMAQAMQTAESLDRLVYHLPHDSYHIGQIMYVRALQGFPPLE
ncbi:MAG TPA: DinB family protein [bacterium]|jgi:hypothetical protein